MTNNNNASKLIPALVSAAAAVICFIALRKRKQRKESPTRQRGQEIGDDIGMENAHPAPVTSPNETQALAVEPIEVPTTNEKKFGVLVSGVRRIRELVHGIHNFFGAGRNNSSKDKNLQYEDFPSCRTSSPVNENALLSSSHATQGDAELSTSHSAHGAHAHSAADAVANTPDINATTASATTSSEHGNPFLVSPSSSFVDDGSRRKNPESLVCCQGDLINHNPKPNHIRTEDLTEPELDDRSPPLTVGVKRPGAVVSSEQHRSRRRRTCKKRPRCRLIVHSSNEV